MVQQTRDNIKLFAADIDVSCTSTCLHFMLVLAPFVVILDQYCRICVLALAAR